MKTDIILDKSKIVFAPNVFTPNGSTRNNVFSITPNCVVKQFLSLDVFDRYGSQVFSESKFANPNAFWDGQKGGTSLASGVYVWYAKVELVDGSLVQLTGDIAILK